MNPGKLLIVALLCLVGVSAQASDDLPPGPVTLIVPFAPGGPSDAGARIVAAALAKQTGLAFVVENVAGAGGTLGVAKAAQSKPDGSVLLWGAASTLTMAPHLVKNVKYDSLKSFVPIGSAGSQPFVLLVRPDGGTKTLKDFLSRARSKAGRLSYPSAGIGSSIHLVTELFMKEAGIEAVHVPYRGGAPALQSLLAGDTDLYFDTPTTAVGYIRSGAVTPLAVTTKSRSPDLPAVPTLNESGFAGFDVATWFGLVAPAGTSAKVVTRLNKELVNALAASDTSEALRRSGFQVEPSTPAEFERRIHADFAKWRTIVQNVGLTAN